MRAATISNPCDSSPSMTWTWPCLWPLTLKSWTGGVSSKQLIWQRALCWLRRKSIVLVLTPDCRKETYWFGNWRGGIKRGVSNSSWNHPEVKEPENSFWYIVHKTSLQSHCVTHFYHYLLNVDPQTELIQQVVIWRLIKMYYFCDSADRLFWWPDLKQPMVLNTALACIGNIDGSLGVNLPWQNLLATIKGYVPGLNVLIFW